MEMTFQSRRGLGAALIVAACFIIYWPAIWGGFIWDDNLLITTNDAVTRASGLGAIWTRPGSMDYTPLTLTGFWLEWRLWEGNPIGYHLVNILLHAGSALVLWRVLRKLTIPAAWLGALIFAVHPVNAASVAWIAERKNTLSLLFYLLAIEWFLDFRETNRPLTYSLALLAALGAYLSKGSTVILPAVLLGCIWWRWKRVTRNDLAACAPFVALAAVMAAVTIHYQARIVSPASGGVSFRIVRAGEAIWFYLWKDLVPAGLCTIYPMWPVDPGAPLSYLPAVAAVLCLALLWAGRERWGRGLFFGWAYFVLALAPVLGFPDLGFMNQAYVADWWQQLALIAPAAALGAALAHIQPRPAMVAISTAGVLFLAIDTWYQAGGYQSEQLFWERALEHNPRAWGAHDNLGNALEAAGQIDGAIAHFRQAKQLKPDEPRTYLNLGNALLARGRPEQAIPEYEAALRLVPKDATLHARLAQAHWRRGAALLEANEPDKAVAEFTEATPAATPEACLETAALLEDRHLYPQAAKLYRAAVAAHPATPGLLNNFALMLACCPDASIRDGATAVSMAIEASRAAGGNNPAILSTLAAAYAEAGRFPEAVSTAREALGLAEAAGDADLVKTIRGAIVLYENGQPYRER